MMTIAEFAELCGTTKDTLRWYDRQGLLQPSTVGDNGYRYYETIQYEEFDLINILKESGSSLDDIRAILHDKTRYLNRSFFHERVKRLDEQLRRLEAMRAFSSAMEEGFTAMETSTPGVPTLLSLPGMWMLQIQLDKTSGRNQDDYVESLLQLQQVAAASENYTRPYPLGVKLALLPAMEGRLEQTHFYCSAKDGTSPSAVFHPGGPVVVIWHRGYYSDIFDTLQIAFRFIHDQGLRACDAIYEADFLTTLADKPENTMFLFTIPVVRDEL